MIKSLIFQLLIPTFFPIIFCLFVFSIYYSTYLLGWLECKSYQKQNRQAIDCLPVNISHSDCTIFITVYKHTKANSVSITLIFFIPAFSKKWEQENQLPFLSCLKSHILFSSIFGSECFSTSACVFLTLSYLGIAHESINVTNGLVVVVVLRPCHESIIPEIAVASWILTCTQIIIWLIFFLRGGGQLAIAALCGTL